MADYILKLIKDELKILPIRRRILKRKIRRKRK